MSWAIGAGGGAVILAKGHSRDRPENWDLWLNVQLGQGDLSSDPKTVEKTHKWKLKTNVLQVVEAK